MSKQSMIIVGQCQVAMSLYQVQELFSCCKLDQIYGKCTNQCCINNLTRCFETSAQTAYNIAHLNGNSASVSK